VKEKRPSPIRNPADYTGAAVKVITAIAPKYLIPFVLLSLVVCLALFIVREHVDANTGLEIVALVAVIALVFTYVLVQYEVRLKYRGQTEEALKKVIRELNERSSASIAAVPGHSSSIAALNRLSTHLSISNQELAQLLRVPPGMIVHGKSGEIVIPPEIEVAVKAADTALDRMLAIVRPELLPDLVRRKVEIFHGRSALDLILEGRIEEVAGLYDRAFR